MIWYSSVLINEILPALVTASSLMGNLFYTSKYEYAWMNLLIYLTSIPFDLRMTRYSTVRHEAAGSGKITKEAATSTNSSSDISPSLYGVNNSRAFLAKSNLLRRTEVANNALKSEALVEDESCEAIILTLFSNSTR